MNKQLSDWASLAEIVSGIAVIMTLILLIFEIRGNTSEIRASALTEIAARTQQTILSGAINPMVVTAIAKEIRGDELSIEDELVLSQRFASLLKLGEESFIAYRDERLEEEIFLTRVEFILDFMANENYHRRWDDRRESGWYVQGYVDWMDTQVAERYGE
jgi:hypothetical protein